MSPDNRRDVLGDRDPVSDDSGAGKTSPPEAVQHRIRVLDTRAWEANHTEPFRFIRWLGALATAVSGLIESYTAHIAMPYLPTLLVVAILLLPDARSITVGWGGSSMKVDLLTNEVTQQRHDVDRLADEVRVISHTMASSTVNIAIGGSEIDTSQAEGAPQNGERREDGLEL